MYTRDNIIGIKWYLAGEPGIIYEIIPSSRAGYIGLRSQGTPYWDCELEYMIEQLNNSGGAWKTTILEWPPIDYSIY